MSGKIGAKLVVKGMTNFKKEMASLDENRRKAGEIAVRVEAFRLKKQMKKEIMAGGIAGHKFAPLRAISKGKPNSRRKPLAELGRHAVRYWIQALSHGRKSYSIGFGRGDVARMDGSYSSGYFRNSRSWTVIAWKHQEGFEVDAAQPSYTGSRRNLRQRFVMFGGGYWKRKLYPRLRQFYFIKKSTKKFKIPARPIVEPFWKYHRYEAERNIISNFNRKMRGERI